MHFFNYYNYNLFRFFMNLLESSLIINQLLYKIYYQNNFFVSINVYRHLLYWCLNKQFNSIKFNIMVFENK